MPLRALGSMQVVPEIADLPRRNGQRLNTVQGFLRAGLLPSTVLSSFRERIADFPLPPGYRFEFGGEAAERDEAVGQLLASVGLLVVLMIATLVLSFQSFRVAALIGVVAILCIGLSMAAVWAFGYPFGFMTIVGTMGLVGVAINDSIVVLAALRESPGARRGEVDATRDVVVRSTRHVLATTFTTIAGFIPLLIDGGLFWPPSRSPSPAVSRARPSWRSTSSRCAGSSCAGAPRRRATRNSRLSRCPSPPSRSTIAPCNGWGDACCCWARWRSRRRMGRRRSRVASRRFWARCVRGPRRAPERDDPKLAEWRTRLDVMRAAAITKLDGLIATHGPEGAGRRLDITPACRALLSPLLLPRDLDKTRELLRRLLAVDPKAGSAGPSCARC